MKEIISVVALLATLYGGTVVIKNIHDTVRKAAMEKSAHGLPSLTELNRSLRASPKHKK